MINNNLLHGLVAASIMVLLAYGGEQWSRKENACLLTTLWLSASAMPLFVVSMLAGGLNGFWLNKSIAHGDTARQCFFYKGEAATEALKLEISMAKDMVAHSERKGYYACLALITHVIERSLTVAGSTCLAISPIFFVIGITR